MNFFLHLYPGDKFAMLAVNVLLQATVVILAAWLLSRLAFPRRAAVRHGLWLAALIFVLISPATAYLMDAANVRILSLSLPKFLTEDETPADVAELPSDPQGAFASAILASEALTPDRSFNERTVFEMRSPRESASTDAAPSAGVSPSETDYLKTTAEAAVVAPPAPKAPRVSVVVRLREVAGLIFGIWLLGVAYGLLRFCRGGLALRRLLRMAQSGDRDERLRPILAQIERHLGLKRMPPVLLWRDSKLRITPLTVGIFRPVIVLSKNLLKSMTPAELRDVLVHECAHVLRRDSAVGLLQRIALMLFWPYPLMALLNRQLTLAREEVCDNYVLLHVPGPQYAQTLFDLSERIQPLSSNLVQVGLFQHYCPLERRVAGLLDMRRNIMTKINRWAALGLAVVFLSIALLAAGSRILQAKPEETKNNETASTTEEKKNPIEEKSNPEMIVTGQVADPNGKALADVQVTVVGRKREPEASASWGLNAERIILGQAKTDAQGHFRISMPRVSSASYYEVHAVVLAEGYGLGFQPVGLDVEKPELKIQLPEEQILQCRLMDAKGSPAAEAIVRVVSIGKGESYKDYAGLYLPDLKEPQPFWPHPLKTDQDGRFTLRGIARDQQVGLQIRDDRFARDDMIIKPAEKKIGGDLTLTPPSSQILEGDVVYEDTRKPVAHARLSIGASKTAHPSTCIMNMPAEADENGHFKVNPYSGELFFITAYPPEGEPYLVFEKEIELKDGKLPSKIDVALPRGVLVRGKVVETPSGKPVAGAGIQYEEMNNPYAKEGTVTGWQAAVTSNAEGAFQIVVPPLPITSGSGNLFVRGPGNDFIFNELTWGPGGGYGRRYYHHGLIPLSDLKLEVQPREYIVSIQRGMTVKGKIVGPEDKPIDEALMVSRIFLNANETTCRCFPVKISNGEFELHGLSPSSGVPVYFLDPKNELGAAVEISGKSAENGPLVVHLEPCGKAIGRFVGVDGKPLVKYRPDLQFVATPGESLRRLGNNHKAVCADQTYNANIDRKNYWDGPLTDNEGRCTFPALIPGATYRFDIYHEPNDLDVKDFTVKSGETLQLPDLKLNIKTDVNQSHYEEAKTEEKFEKKPDDEFANIRAKDQNEDLRGLSYELLPPDQRKSANGLSPTIQKRTIDKSIKDFPEKIDLSTPESAFASWKRFAGVKTLNDLSWRKWENFYLQENYWGKTPKNPANNIVEVLIYRDELAEVIFELNPADGDLQYGGEFFGKIGGRWKGLSQFNVGFPELSVLEDIFDSKKDELWTLFLQIKKDVGDDVNGTSDVKVPHIAIFRKGSDFGVAIQRRAVNKLVKDFPEEADLSTPESAYAAIEHSIAKNNLLGLKKMTWTNLYKLLAGENASEIDDKYIENLENDLKYDPHVPQDLGKMILEQEILQVLTYRDDLAEILIKRDIKLDPEGPYGAVYLGKIHGQWKALSGPGGSSPNLEDFPKYFEQNKETFWNLFQQAKKDVGNNKEGITEVAMPVLPLAEKKTPPDEPLTMLFITEIQSKSLQKELNLTAAQTERLIALSKATGDALGKEGSSMPQNSRISIVDKAFKELREILSPKQLDRAKEILIQYDSSMAFDRENIAKALELSDHQKSEIHGILQKGSEELIKQTAMAGTTEGTKEKRREMIRMSRNLMDADVDAIMKVLSPEQRAKYEKMIGKKFDAIKVMDEMDELKKAVPAKEEQPAEKAGPHAIDRRAVNKLVKDFPEEADLSTPESAFAAVMVACTNSNVRDLEKRSWTHWVKNLGVDLKELEKNLKNATPPDAKYLKTILETEVLQVLTYRDDLAEVIYKNDYPNEGEGPYAAVFFGKINGAWKCLTCVEKYSSNLEAFHKYFEENKESQWNLFQQVKKDVGDDKDGKSLVNLRVLPTDEKKMNQAEKAIVEARKLVSLRAAFEHSQRDSRKTEVIRLRAADPQETALSIKTMLGISSDAKDNPADAPKIEADIAKRQLQIEGTEEQIAQIRQILEKMGETDKASAIQRRKVNKLVKDFPEKTDLSTPESALAAYHRASAKKDAKAVLELGWRKYGQTEIDDIERFWKSDTPEQMAIYLQAVLDAEVREVRIYKDDLAVVIAKLKFPEGIGRHPFTARAFGRIDGQWKNLGENRLPSLEAARFDADEKKELGWAQFVALRDEIAGKQPPEAPSNEVKVPSDRYAAVKATTPDSQRLILMGLVENFFNHNAVDITARKSLEWGEVKKNDDGSRSIRYKFEARIWDKETLIFDRVFTFDKDNVMIAFKDLNGPPAKKEPKKFDVNSKEGMQKLVEEFFSNNFRDITSRETLEWGEVEKDKDGNSSIRYKYEATIWSKDIQIMNQIFTFDKKGEFVDFKNVEGYPKKESKSP
jgi:beta-lactamase regulating signal transducer with metallopeptidase domain